MITRITSNHSKGDQFQWVVVTEPTIDILKNITTEFNLHRLSVQDCLEPYHLPKFERHDEYSFIIIRVIDTERKVNSSDINQLTRKIAVFLGKNFLITINRVDLPFMKELREKWAKRIPRLIIYRF